MDTLPVHLVATAFAPFLTEADHYALIASHSRIAQSYLLRKYEDVLFNQSAWRLWLAATKHKAEHVHVERLDIEYEDCEDLLPIFAQHLESLCIRGEGNLEIPKFPEMPFLDSLDLRSTSIANFDLKQVEKMCPRLKHIG